MSTKIPKSEKRSFREIKLHYDIEKELANRLKNATQFERRQLYGLQYDELLNRVPDHPQLILADNSKKAGKKVSRQLDCLERFLRQDQVFLEIGAGDCSLATEVARRVKKVYAIDVSTSITQGRSFPPEFELIISDGVRIPVPPNSVSIAYSYQFIEHLHPDDAMDHLQNVNNALTPGGIYLCITPNRLVGPHDISKYFDEIATGFHLKEYTGSELVNSFGKAGFSKTASYIGGRKLLRFIPVSAYERLLSALPYSFRRQLVAALPFGALWDIAIVGTK